MKINVIPNILEPVFRSIPSISDMRIINNIEPSGSLTVSNKKQAKAEIM